MAYSNSDCELEVLSGSESDIATPDSKRKFSGSATYDSKFDPSWRAHYPCIDAAKDNPHSFFCKCCVKKVSCKHMGLGDVKRHRKHLKAWTGSQDCPSILTQGTKK